jgi:hypothetical protein
VDDTLLDQVPEQTRELAGVGPREAAAYYVVFHWNRAKLSFGRQALITEALAGETEGRSPSDRESRAEPCLNDRTHHPRDVRGVSER